MKIYSVFDINFKKLRFRTGRALYLIVPMILLVSLSLVISSQVKNIEKALKDNVFASLEEDNTIIELDFQREDFGPGNFGGDMSDMQTSFNESDLAVVSNIDNVENASISYTIPLTKAVSYDLFEDKEVSLNNLISLSPSMASIYTTEDFEYVHSDDAVVPIILNANAFMESYEDWEGEDSFTVDFHAMREQRVTGEEEEIDPRQTSPIKSTAIEYDKDDLIDKEFTIVFGGLDSVATYERSMVDGAMTFTKLSDTEIEANNNEMLDVIDEYWDTDELAKGVSYTFKVVGVIEDSTDNSIYVPEGFGNEVINSLVALQEDARTNTDLDEDLLGDQFTGIYYDGLELSTQVGGIGFGGGMGRPGGGFGMGLMGGDRSGGVNTVEDSTSYSIPGLIIETDSNTGEVEGVMNDSDLLDSSVKTGETILIRINNILDRSQVIEDLNEEGYAIQDINNLEALESLQSNLSSISRGVIVAFILVTILVIIITMSKVVSESTKEIGIFRAVGFTKGNIFSIFMSQGLIYTLIGYIAGVIWGVILNFLSSNFVGNWFEGFVDSSLSDSLNFVGDIDTSIFNRIDINSMLLLTAILFVVTLVISYIPAMKASNISPVEAIKSE